MMLKAVGRAGIRRWYYVIFKVFTPMVEFALVSTRFNYGRSTRFSLILLRVSSINACAHYLTFEIS